MKEKMEKPEMKDILSSRFLQCSSGDEYCIVIIYLNIKVTHNGLKILS